MITHVKREFPFLDHSSEDALYVLARLMINIDFIAEKRVTPLRSSLLFLRRIGAAVNPPVETIKERDFVFLIKMFGLKVRNKNGLLEFLPDNEWIDDSDEDGKPATEVKIENGKDAQLIEKEVSDIKRHRKIHEKRIDAGTNRLLRWYRDNYLALVLAERVLKENEKIGEAREFLRVHHDVKDHEYVRIRKRAFELGLIESSRTARRKNMRVTLDMDCAVWIEQLLRETRFRSRTPTYVVNTCLRDLYEMSNSGRKMPPAPKLMMSDDLEEGFEAAPARAGRAPVSGAAASAKGGAKPAPAAKKKPAVRRTSRA
ncbi:hypothetical protein FAZ69_08435 [Trinickia terrae]|uniref:Uncharacterized protein n=1 Tax=Trinickia terrae TaxID=2571161 RepID=A0A4U1I9K3_9BURK|nr:hypothetical protein [Trinickia terrae]TKC90166.1 hypothetical protein FAZ69_08435 [Trinickia terrae]